MFDAAILIRIIDDRIERALRRYRIGAIRGQITTIEELDGGAKLKAAVSALQAGSAVEQTRPARLVQQYGLASRPLVDAECIVLPVGGRSSQGVIIATEDARYRLLLSDGEVALYDHLGQVVKLTKNGDIEISATSMGKIVLNSGTMGVAADGDVCTHTLMAPAGGGAVTGTINVGTAGRAVKV